MKCTICQRKLNVPSDQLSGDCGGDCWGCVGAIEAENGWEPSLTMVRKEFASGLRPGWKDPYDESVNSKSDFNESSK
jgi:hypothetical protein